MRLWAFAALGIGFASPLLFACSGGDATGGPSSAASGDDAASSVSDGASSAMSDAADASCTLWVDDAGVTHGCNRGSMGPGDRDDGGDAGAPPPSDASPDASDLPFGASCLHDAQCASGICFDYVVKGTFCTQTCKTNADCPPSSLGCNGMGVCRVGS
jgi:hypothetical protein